MSESEQLINYWSEQLTERLIEIRFIDKDDMRAAINSHIKLSLFDCLHAQLPETMKKLYEARKKVVVAKVGVEQIKAEIIALKQNLKEQNMLYSELSIHNKNREMALYFRENYEKALLDFYAYYDKNFPKTDFKDIKASQEIIN